MPILTAADAAAGTDPWVVGAAVVAVLAGVFAALGYLINVAHKTFRTLDDLRGEPGRPGVPARLGILERMAASEAAATATAGQVAATRQDLAVLSTQMGGLSRQIGEAVVPAVAQLQPNHGTSLHDKIMQISLDTAHARTLGDRP